MIRSLGIANIRAAMASPEIIRDSIISILISLALVAAVTIGLAVLDRFFTLRHVSIIYLIPVVIAAAKLGVVPALIAAIGGLGASAFFFYPPIYSFLVNDPEQLIDLPLFIFVALVINQLATNLRRQAAIARQHEIEVQGLYEFSRRLAAAHTASDIQTAIRDHLVAIIGQRTIFFETSKHGRVGPSLSAQDAVPESVRRETEAFVSGGKEIGGGIVVDGGQGHLWLVRPVSEKTADFGVLAIDLGQQSKEAGEALRQRVNAVMADTAATLERLDLGQAINAARIRSETEALRDALIGSVSHQLRTPLVSILGAATVISQAPANRDNGRLQSLANILGDEVERLNSDVQDLLDATVISSKGVQPNYEWMEAADIVNAAIERRQRLLAEHKVVVDLPDDLPLIYVDPILLAQALGQVIDNAVKYSPHKSSIDIAARANGMSVVLSVKDEGIGLVGEEQTRLWERFYRGERHASKVTGSGLGLWIAQAFVAANDGEMEAASAGADRGTTIFIRLPASEKPAEDDE
ncbi:MAG: DUF4118 domain-containing protein [Hyphomicrobiales bacterium]